jgi:hypothetical protein
VQFTIGWSWKHENSGAVVGYNLLFFFFDQSSLSYVTFSEPVDVRGVNMSKAIRLYLQNELLGQPLTRK